MNVGVVGGTLSSSALVVDDTLQLSLGTTSQIPGDSGVSVDVEGNLALTGGNTLSTASMDINGTLVLSSATLTTAPQGPVAHTTTSIEVTSCANLASTEQPVDLSTLGILPATIVGHSCNNTSNLSGTTTTAPACLPTAAERYLQSRLMVATCLTCCI